MLKRLMYTVLGVSAVVTASAREPINASAPIRFQLKPQSELVVSSEIAGRLNRLPFKEGDSFHKGEVLAGVNCDIYGAKLSHARAEEKLAEQKYKIAKRLNKLESISMLEVGQSEADLDMARSERRVAQLMVNRCKIKATFDGRISQRFVQPGEFVTEGTKLLEIYNTKAYEVELIVPSRWINLVRVGQPFQVTLDETQDTYQAKVIRLGGVIDALSQSYKVFGEILAQPDLVLMPGMSGSAVLTVADEHVGEHADEY